VASPERLQRCNVLTNILRLRFGPVFGLVGGLVQGLVLVLGSGLGYGLGVNNGFVVTHKYDGAAL